MRSSQAKASASSTKPLINVGEEGLLGWADQARLKQAITEVIDNSTSLSLDSAKDRRTLKRRLLKSIGWP